MTGIIKYNLTDKQIEFATEHAKRMSAGASTRSFKSGTTQNTDVYFIGKIGELGVYKFLKENSFTITHKPFRESYDKFNWNDDFQVALGERTQQIEVRCKARNCDYIKQDFYCCSDCIKPSLDYFFTSYCRADNTVSLLGWADWHTWAKYGEQVKAGYSNENFTHRVNEFQLKIMHLRLMKDYRIGF